MSEIFLLPEYADKINASWRKTTESVLETARLCADANKDLKSKDRARLIKQLAFNAATFSKLVKIGSKYQLQSDPLKSLLPPSYSIVYEVAKLNEGDLQVAITEGVINPGMTRRDLDAWIGKTQSEDAHCFRRPDSTESYRDGPGPIRLRCAKATTTGEGIGEASGSVRLQS